MLAVPPSQAQCHGSPWVPPQEKEVPMVGGKEEKNWAVIKSCCHQHCQSAWKQTGWNLPSKTAQQITHPHTSAPRYLCLLLRGSVRASHPQLSLPNNSHMLLQLLWPFSFHCCPPRLPNVAMLLFLWHLLCYLESPWGLGRLQCTPPTFAPSPVSMLQYEVISQDTAGASCNTKGKPCKLKPKSKTKRT